jgi:hypothetical protein
MEIEDFEARVERVGDPPALWKLFTTFFRGSSIDRVIYHHFPPLGASDADMVRIAADGVPEDMVKQYVEDRPFPAMPVDDRGASPAGSSRSPRWRPCGVVSARSVSPGAARSAT